VKILFSPYPQVTNMQILGVVSFVVSFALLVSAASRTSPPSGALVVRAGTTNSGEYKTINAALAALPNDGSTRSIFIYGGTYNEQVYITRKGKLTVC
jgi:pectinesterase